MFSALLKQCGYRNYIPIWYIIDHISLIQNKKILKLYHIEKF